MEIAQCIHKRRLAEVAVQGLSSTLKCAAVNTRSYYSSRTARLAAQEGLARKLAVSQQMFLGEEQIRAALNKEWTQEANQLLHWQQRSTKVQVQGLHDEVVTCNSDGSLNASENCLDRHLKARGDNIAVIWRGLHANDKSQMTYNELHKEVCTVANALEDIGLRRGDSAVLNLPRIPQAVTYMLACARVGVSYTVAHPDTDPDVLERHIEMTDPNLVVTVDSYVDDDGKGLKSKATIDGILKNLDNLKSEAKVVVVDRHGEKVAMHQPRDMWHEELLRATSSAIHPPPKIPAMTPLYRSLYSKMKVPHSTAAYLMHVQMSLKHEYDFSDRDIFWCTSDFSCTNGHSYGIYGPLLRGAATVIYEPDPLRSPTARLWETVDDVGVTILLATADAVQSWMFDNEKSDQLANSSRKSLRVVASVGMQPVSASGWRFLHNLVGGKRCVIAEVDNLANSIREELPCLLPPDEAQHEAEDCAAYMVDSCYSR